MALHDSGILLADNQAELTPMQRFVYIMSKDAHTDDKAKKPPSGMKKGHQATKGW